MRSDSKVRITQTVGVTSSEGFCVSACDGARVHAHVCAHLYEQMSMKTRVTQGQRKGK